MLADFDLPRSYIFFYYKLRHAVHAQFSSLENPIAIPQLEKVPRHPDLTKLISTYYAALMTDSNPRFRMAQTKWNLIDSTLTQDDWSAFSDTYKTSVISFKDRINNIKIFHLSHITPASLHKLWLTPTAECCRGCGQTTDFLHCFWTCSIVQHFRTEMGTFISSAMGLPNILHPKNCLLGIFSDFHIWTHAKRLLHILHFYVRKTILFSWKGSQTPLKSLWLKLINELILSYKLTFRG